MADDRLRKLQRAAEATRDPLEVEAAARAFTQAGRADEACGLWSRLGTADPAFLDELAPGSIDELVPAPIGEPYSVQKLSHVVWAPDGRTLYAADDKQAVLAWDVETGARRVVAPLATCVKAMAVDAEGERLLLCVADGRAEGKKTDDLQVVDLRTGTLGPRLTTQLKLVMQVSFARHDPRLLVVQGRHDGTRRVGHWAEAFRLEGKTAVGPVWRETAPLLSLHGDGLVSVKRLQLGFHPSDVPDTPHLVPTGCRSEDTDRLSAAGTQRALVSGDALWLVDAQGATLATSTVPRSKAYFAPDCWQELVASPSGRQAAVVAKTNVLTLIDVATGKVVARTLDARPRRPVWSPSGRKLAVPLDSGTVLVLRAGGVLAPSRVSAEEPWLALVKAAKQFGPPSEWCARVVGARLELRWGPRGGRASTKSLTCADEAAARAELERRVRAKRGEGYS